VLPINEIPTVQTINPAEKRPSWEEVERALLSVKPSQFSAITDTSFTQDLIERHCKQQPPKPLRLMRDYEVDRLMGLWQLQQQPTEAVL
jgi:hypothetical protein